jgi:hypothetical protein
MAIIQPSITFEGAATDLNPSAATSYILDGVRRALFNKSTNKEGAYLYFLPAYTTDRAGNGVWYKKFSIRDSFGVNYKEKYYVKNKAEDPAEYFGQNFIRKYPEEAKVGEVEVGGRKFKKYPNHGRAADRVVFNVAFLQNLELGCHVLDLPFRNGADILLNWQTGKDVSGKPRKPVNSPDRCIPVFVKLRENSANPWMIQVEANEPIRLPDELADSEYLYNLDEIFETKSKEEIIAKLREMYSSDVFEDCMYGYPGLTQSSSARRATSTREYDEDDLDTEPVVPSIPKATIPKASIPKATITAPAVPMNPPAVADISSLPPNPMAGGKMSREAAMRYINQE